MCPSYAGSWKLQLADASARQTPQVILDNLFDQCEYAWSYFVPSAPAYLDFNLKPSLGLANGTACLLHSLVFDEIRTNLEEIEANYAATSPGEFVEVPAPAAVNVELTGAAAKAWPDKGVSMLEKTPPVLPLPTRSKSTIPLWPKVLSQAHRQGRRHALVATTSWYELGFSSTFHKVQGKAVKKIVLCLNKQPRDLGRISTQALYVGITCVRRNDHMRIFP